MNRIYVLGKKREISEEEYILFNLMAKGAEKVCGEIDKNMYVCTRKFGHTGLHIAASKEKVHSIW